MRGSRRRTLRPRPIQGRDRSPPISEPFLARWRDRRRPITRIYSPQYHPSLSQNPPSISQGRAHQDHPLRSEPLGPVPPNQRGVQLRKVSPCNVAGQEKPIQTLWGMRTRSGNVCVEHEQGTDQIGGIGSSGRWVCQCGSTFVRDSDWETCGTPGSSLGFYLEVS